MMTSRSQLWENLGALLSVGLLMGGCALILAPFATVLLWAAIVSYTSWNLYRSVSARLGGRETLAATLLVGVMIVAIVLPLALALAAFAAQAVNITQNLNQAMEEGLPMLPDWVSSLPWLGERLSGWWIGLAEGDPAVLEQVRAGLLRGSGFLLQAGKAAGQGLGVLLLSCVLVFFFYVGGARAGFWLASGLHRIAGPRGQQLLLIAGQTVKSVVFGILGTAVAQGALAGIGFAVAGVPAPIVLGLITALLSVVPFGPALLWLPAAAWLYHDNELFWAGFIVAWGVLVVGMADNVLKPLLIGKGTNLPFLLIMLGVLGGAMSFGLLGVFIGPTLLAVGFAVLKDWVLIKAEEPLIKSD
jgi:predicted PurR-regulated permease PerM